MHTADFATAAASSTKHIHVPCRMYRLSCQQQCTSQLQCIAAHCALLLPSWHTLCPVPLPTTHSCRGLAPVAMTLGSVVCALLSKATPPGIYLLPNEYPLSSCPCLCPCLAVLGPPPCASASALTQTLLPCSPPRQLQMLPLLQTLPLLVPQTPPSLLARRARLLLRRELALHSGRSWPRVAYQRTKSHCSGGAHLLEGQGRGEAGCACV